MEMEKIYLLFSKYVLLVMAFDNVYGLEGGTLTYRGYWVIVLDSFAAFQIISSLCVSLLCFYCGPGRAAWKGEHPSNKWQYIAAGVSFLYAFLLMGLAIANGAYVFGGESLHAFIGYLFLCHGIFAAVAIFVKRPLLAAYISSVSNWAMCGSIFFLIQSPSMFDYAPANLTWLIAFFASIPLVLQGAVTYMDVMHFSVQTWRGRLSLSVRSLSFQLTLLGVFGIGILLTYFFAGSCITVYDPDIGGAWVTFATLRWNSRMMRSTTAKPCEGSGPCHVYLTAGADLTSEVFVNVHMPPNLTSGLWVKVVGGSTIVATEFETPLLDYHDSRSVFSAHLSALPAGAEIAFSLETSVGPVGEEVYYFRTAPLGEDFNFVVAGDSGLTSETLSVITEMIATDPYLGIIGGDVAYDNGLMACACAWDEWLTAWESNRVQGKYLVPLSLAIGNHDVGVNDNNDGAYASLFQDQCDPHSSSHAPPLFFAWFPHEVDQLTGQPLPVCQRTAVRAHSVPNLLNLWMLDSAYSVSPEFNVDFVATQLATQPQPVLNMAIYHVPLYSSNKEDESHGNYLIEAWASPLFDAHAFSLCFENHAHTYKRTKPLFANKVSTDPALGTVYLGDGKMGVTGMAVPDSSGVIAATDSSVFEKTGTQHHFFNVRVTSNRDIQVAAIDNLGIEFDQWGT